MSGLKICTICARGGSKGVPGKNVRMIAGKPLIAHSVEQALKTRLFEEVAVSSDSVEILEAAKAAGATILIRRPDELATDGAAKIPVIQHALLSAERISGKRFEILVDLDATSPLRNTADIIGSVNRLLETDAQNVLSVMPARRSPYFNLLELDEEGYARLSKPPASPVVSRQASPRCFDINGSVYVWHRESLLGSQNGVILDRTHIYEMPEERSIDIDTPLDFAFVEFLFSRRAANASS